MERDTLRKGKKKCLRLLYLFAAGVVVAVLCRDLANELGRGIGVVKVVGQEVRQPVQFGGRDLAVRRHERVLHRAGGLRADLAVLDGVVHGREDRGGNVLRQGGVGVQRLHHFLDRHRRVTDSPRVIVGRSAHQGVAARAFSRQFLRDLRYTSLVGSRTRLTSARLRGRVSIQEWRSC